MIEGSERRVVAGDALLHPVPLAAVALLLVNDHVLKSTWPGLVTGKLSDFAGLVFFPVLLQAIWEIACLTCRRPVTRSLRVLATATVLTIVAFTFAKVLPAGADAYRLGLSVARWPFGALFDLAAGAPVRDLARVSFVRDLGDLVALPAALFGFLAVPKTERFAVDR